MTGSKILLTVLAGAALGAVVGTFLTSEKGEKFVNDFSKSAGDWLNNQVNNLAKNNPLFSGNGNAPVNAEFDEAQSKGNAHVL